MTDPDDDPRACIREIECASCGGEFEADGILLVGFSGGAHSAPAADEFKPDYDKCPACLELGHEPPRSPCCDESMRGTTSTLFECRQCDAQFEVAVIRAYGFGLEAGRILNERPTAAGAAAECGVAGASGRREEILALVLRAARAWGVI